MNEIKSRILVSLELAQTDFSVVNEIFGKYSHIAMDPVMRDRVSEGIKYLQYMDTLTQKLNHIVSINQALAAAGAPLQEGTTDADPAEFIFRLNYFQAMIAQEEFLMTISKLQELIEGLNKAQPLEHIVPLSWREPFRNREEEERNMNSISLSLRSMYTDRLLENRNGACPLPVVTQLAKLYTMNSERLILEWLQNHPLDDITELMRIYSHSGFGQEEQQADFF